VALHNDRSIGGQIGGKVFAVVLSSFGARQYAKRLFDIVAAATTLVLLSPIMLIVSVAVKIDSRGPVFSRETLYGYGNRSIRVLKFRSMKICVETSRFNFGVTPVGRMLRQTGIDELPQLLQVLHGEMSIVGPRPHASRQYLFGSTIMPLLNVKPGMISWSQIAESREGFRTTEQRIDDDRYYVENWSFFLDIKIILIRTFSQRACASNDLPMP
jgi:lipopolysaccharide/colanic/teichoic acid biosynthesis glycosyltransferase